MATTTTTTTTTASASNGTTFVDNEQTTVVMVESKNIIVDAATSCDKRKLSPDIGVTEQTNVVKKLKDTKTQPGKTHCQWAGGDSQRE